MINNKIMSLTLKFDDGTEANFSGPVIENIDKKKVVDIICSEPLDLPDNYHWETLNELIEKPK